MLLQEIEVLIIPKGSMQVSIDYVRFINVKWTVLSRELMRMSSDPKTPFQVFVGASVNTCRHVFNNFHILLIVLVCFFIILAVLKNCREK